MNEIMKKVIEEYFGEQTYRPTTLHDCIEIAKKYAVAVNKCAVDDYRPSTESKFKSGLDLPNGGTGSTRH